MPDTTRRVKIVFEGEDKTASKTTGNVLKSIQKLGKVAVAAGAAATAAIVGIGAGLAKLAIDAAPLEGISSAFEGLTQNMEGGSKRMLAALEEASGGMITQRDLMLSFNKAAQLVSVDFAQRLPDAMGALGKVAAATGQDLDFLLDSLVTGVGRLSPMILDNLGIQVDMTAAMEDYAKSIGKTVGELTKQEQQTALMNQVLEKLNANTADMPDVTQTAAAAMARFQTTVKNLKDQLGVALLPALSKIMGVFGELASRILPPLAAWFEDKIVPIVDKVAQAFETFFSALDSGLSPATAIKAALMRLFGANSKIKESFGALEKILKPLLQTFRDIRYIVTEFFGQLSMGKDPIDALLTALREMYGAAGPFGEAFSTLRDIWQSVRDTVIGFFTSLGPIMDALREMRDAVLPALAALWNEAILPALEKIKQAFTDAFGESQVSLVDIIVGAIQGFSDILVNFLIPAVTTVVEWLGNILPPIIQTLAQIWQNVLQPAIQFVWQALQVLLPIIVAVAEVIGAILGVAIKVVAGIIQNVLIPAITAVVGWIGEKLQPVFAAISEFISTKVVPWLEKLGFSFDKSGGAVKNVVGFLKQFANMLKSIKLPDWLTPGSGTPFEGGILGILKAIKNLVALAGPILQGLAKGPLKVLDTSGKVLAETFTKILKDAMKQVREFILQDFMPVLTALATEAIPFLRAAIETLAGAFGDTLLPDLVAVVGSLAEIGPSLQEIIDISPALQEAIRDRIVPQFRAWNTELGAIVSRLQTIINKLNDIINLAQQAAGAINDIPDPPSPQAAALAGGGGIGSMSTTSIVTTNNFTLIMNVPSANAVAGFDLMKVLTGQGR